MQALTLTALEGTFLNQYQSGLRHFVMQKTVLGSLANGDFSLNEYLLTSF